MDYPESFQALRTEAPALAAELEGAHTLERVLVWMRGRGLPLGSVEIIAQDEFSLDFIITLGRDGQHLVFGIT